MGQKFRHQIALLPNLEDREIMDKLMRAYDLMIELTRTYPEQHQYDEFQLGLERCLDALKLPD